MNGRLSKICLVHTYGHGTPKRTEIEKKSLGMAPIFFDQVYPKDHKNAQMKIFYVCLDDEMQFF